MMENETFSCRHSNLSSTDITNRSFWRITENKQIGAGIAGGLVLLFFIVGLVWNLFIIITYVVRHQLLREPANVFLFNVAIVDLVVCLTTMIFTFVTAFGNEFLFGNTDVILCAMCGVSGFFLTITVLSSLHLLSALSVDRFLHLWKPLHYSKIMNPKRAIAICIFIYGLCFLLSILPHVGFGEIEFNSRFASCVPRFQPISNLYFVVLIATEMIIPIGILTVTSFWTFRLIRVFLKKNFRRRSLYRRKGKEREDGAKESSKHQRQQTQLVKVFGALFIANIFSYTPTIVMSFIVLGLELVSSGKIVPPSEIYIFAFVSYLTNPVLHPIIESFFVKDLRYQVNRAKKGIRRASTIIYRQTTQLMGSKALEEANKKMDAEEASRVSKNGTSKRNGKSIGPNESMITEMESLAQSRSSSPQNNVLDSSDAGRPESIGDERASEKRKTRQSVSFQESSFSEAVENGKTPPPRSPKSPKSPKSKQNGKNSLLAMKKRKNAIQEEPEDIESIRTSSPSN